MLSAALLLQACATTPLKPEPLIAQSKRIEEKPLPPDPVSEPIPDGFEKGEWVVPIEKGQPAQQAGVVVSEARAWRDGQYRIRYKELRANYESDKQLFSVHRDYYEDRAVAAAEQIKSMEPNWFERHALVLGLAGGFLAGAAATVAVVAAVNQVQP